MINGGLSLDGTNSPLMYGLLITTEEKTMQRKPTSPGEILVEEFLVPLKISQKELAEHLNCDYKVINRIVNEQTSITPEMAIKLAAAFNTTPDFWLNAQMAMDLWTLRSKKTKIRPLIHVRRRSRILR
jgi:addiction module HigA family antidote